MKTLSTALLLILGIFGTKAQEISISGILIDNTQSAIPYANVVIYDEADNIIKVATTDETGKFVFYSITSGKYKLVASFVGFGNYTNENLIIEDGKSLDLGKITLISGAVELETATVTAKRALVEIKPDRTVFNVQGTINSVGDNGLGLLRKAPGVLVDNNDNITVLGRSGVLVYVDGKRLPLSGDELKSYLEGLTAEQIDRMDIITNPGAKYEAEGNAGIIDIRLKKDKNLGSNGSINSTVSQGKKFRYNLGSTGNYRNKVLNTFGSLGYNGGTRLHEMYFINHQNQLILDEENITNREFEGYNYRWGTDFFIAKDHTIGFLISGGNNTSDVFNDNKSNISKAETPDLIDSVLVANNVSDKLNKQNTYNLNYVYNPGKKSSLNIDLDFGKYRNTNLPFQPNRYYNDTESTLLTENITRYETSSVIDIYTAKLDYEIELPVGRLGLGGKFSQVNTDNEFLFFNEPNLDNTGGILNDQRSNQFDYNEQVMAGYANLAGSISKKLNYSAGLRIENTDAEGILEAFDPSLNEDPVIFNYISYFPSAGLTFTPSRIYSWSLNYGKRINRPDYNVLNPFEEQLSELSFSKGNPFLNPEIVNNLELGLTYKYMYNFKLAYSRTTDQITRLIGPDNRDPRAGFISWANLSTQTVVSFNAALPFQFNPWWSAFLNLSTSYIDNQADYGSEGSVDLQAFSYNLYQQSTFQIGRGYSAEISGWYSGPGVWGGVFEYNSNYSLNFGLQKKFFNNNLNVKLSAQDVTYQSGWDGVSEFNGLIGEGMGNWDSRFVSLSLNYKLGNNNVKSRKRKTGIESESKRVGNGN